jgi:hypothetical protein
MSWLDKYSERAIDLFSNQTINILKKLAALNLY